MSFSKTVAFCFAFSFLLTTKVQAQKDSLRTLKREKWKLESSNKGLFYISWGYNRSWFTKSTIHFHGPQYDLTFFNLAAHDNPSPFSFGVYFNPEKASIPQYNLHIGYFFTSRFHLSFGIDHMKYVITQNQQAVISGVVSPTISTKYAGSYLNDTITLKSEILRFEHTNGLNLVSLDVEYLQPLANLYKHKIWLKWNTGVGGFMVITKTDMSLLGDGVDNDFHLSGYSVTAKTGPRLEFWKRFFIASELKVGYMNLPNVNINNDAPQKADHNFSFVQWYTVLGAEIPLRDWLRKKKK